jgi:hypothetical protein
LIHRHLSVINSIEILGTLRPRSHRDREAFVAAAEAMHNEYVFCISKDNSLVACEGHSTASISVFKREGEKKTFKGESNQQEIEAFVKEASTALLLEALHNEPPMRPSDNSCITDKAEPCTSKRSLGSVLL